MLHTLFSNFQADEGLGILRACRTDELLFFILSNLAARMSGERANGMAVAYGLSQGMDLPSALEFGTMWNHYKSALDGLARRTTVAMTFLRRDRGVAKGREPVHTISRKRSVTFLGPCP